MFRKNRNNSQGKSSIRTLIDAKTVISGDLSFAGGLHLDGRVIGNVTAAEGAGAFLSVSESGTIEGSVVVPTIVLNGQVKGDIEASEHIKLGARARVTGNVTYVQIETEVGAQINGKLIHRGAGGAPATEVQAQGDLAGEAL